MTDPSDDFVSLDSLFGEAINRVHRAAAQPKRSAAEPAKAEATALFSDPTNWRRTRGVALIHVETESLLGNFSEYVHRSVANCRKLIREDSPIAVSATERIVGSWWITDTSRGRIEPRREWHTRQTAALHVYLDQLQLHSPECQVVACLSFGAISRVELTADTSFTQTAGPEQILLLPAGTNILPEMSHDSKVALRVELALP